MRENFDMFVSYVFLHHFPGFNLIPHMSTAHIIIIVVAAVTLLLLMVLKLKISAFISLLITSMFVGILSGMPLQDIMVSIQEGMGGTLGFVAVVVGLGAIFGQILESSGGAESLAHHLVKKFGTDRASWAMVITGFIVAIPVFLDVGLVILAPIIYALSRDTKRSLLYYGIPLLAGLAVTHSFMPPTPGPIAVADILDAQLGWVIFFGFLLGFPTAIIAGPVFGKFIAGRIHIDPPEEMMGDASAGTTPQENLPSFRSIALIIAVPLFLILVNTFTAVLVDKEVIAKTLISDILIFLGHPFSALIIAALLAIYFLGIKRGKSRQELLDLSSKALGPAGIIILVTGAGGVLKQILVDSGIGEILANSIADSAMPPILLAWILAAIVRVTQGSATVAMITAAGIIAPILSFINPGAPELALIVISIASGATLLSHVNDSGFWLVSKYFGMDEKQTLRSWTMMESIIALCGLAFTMLASLFV
jgi:Gnt-I system low-affinity gluconate transporter